MRLRQRQLRILQPQILLFRSDLDVGEITRLGEDILFEDFATLRRIVGPVVAVRRLRAVDVPLGRRVALVHHLAHQLERARHHGAAAFRRMEEGVLVDFLGARVVTNEHDLDAFVVALQEQVQQDEEALREILALFVHRARHVHQAEHHGLARRLRLLDAIHVAQIERIDERNPPDAPFQMVDLGFERRDFRTAIFRIVLQRLELCFELAQLVHERRTERDAPAERASERAHDVDVVRRAFRRPARAHVLPARHREQVRLHEARQFEIVEEVLHEFVARQLEHEVVLPFAVVARLTAAAARAALRARNLVAAHVVLVAGVHVFTTAARPVPEGWLRDVLARNRDALRALDILDATIAHRVRHGTTNVVLDATQKAFAVGDALVLAGQPAVDDLMKHSRSPARKSICRDARRTCRLPSCGRRL